MLPPRVPREVRLLRKETGEETDIFRNLVSTTNLNIYKFIKQQSKVAARVLLGGILYWIIYMILIKKILYFLSFSAKIPKAFPQLLVDQHLLDPRLTKFLC
jgi:hypothetical protein